MSVRLKVVQRSLALLLGIVIGTGTAVLVGEFVRSPAEAHLNPWGHTWPYSFGSSNCGWNTEKDPIQVVFYWNATPSNVHIHSDHHGWGVNEGTTASQYFDNHGCAVMSGQRSTLLSVSPYPRYHQRWDTTYGDATWQTYSLATPHFEDRLSCGHAVRENNNPSMPGGGFINAKHEIDRLWTYNWPGGGAIGNHYWKYAQDWDNERWFLQCDGQHAWGNGFVDFIKIS